MPKYILGFHGGGAMPTDPVVAEKSMAAWISWYKSMGDAVIDMGTPALAKKTVAPGDRVVDGGGANPLTGYSIIEAGNIDQAVNLAEGCPIYAANGSVEVAELLPM